MWINCALDEFVKLAAARYGRVDGGKRLVGIILAPGHREDVQKHIQPSLGYCHSISGELLHLYAVGYEFTPKPEKIEDFPRAQLTFDSSKFKLTLDELKLTFCTESLMRPFRYNGTPQIVLGLLDLATSSLDPTVYKVVSLAPTLNGKLKFDELVHEWEHDVQQYPSDQILHAAKTRDDLMNFQGGLLAIGKWAAGRIGLKL